MNKKARAGWLAGVAVVVSMGLAACSSASADPDASGGSDGPNTELSIVAYSVAQAPNQAVQAAFAKTDEGKGVTWVESYGASGDQSRAVESGLKADYVHFSLSSDVTRLVDAGLVADDWDQGATHGIVTSSVVVFVVRPGNPKNIQSWDDLIKPGVQVITPNPGSSGSARWNILAAWGSVIANGGSEEAAKTYTTALFNNVVSLPGSGREATSAFIAGTGDVLLSYENEAIAARQSGADIDYVVPDTTLRIDNPGTVTKDADPKAKAFLDFVLTPEAQAIYASFGYRPVVDGVTLPEIEGANDPANPFPTPSKLQTIDDFGGWGEAKKKYFDEDTGIITVIQVDTGKSS
ncbi:MAG: sulfate ABC transporter substrate-binding protein [Demequina sp.]|nr:sulfate ABC transporter substrate-binding protein [Demequina sp.]